MLDCNTITTNHCLPVRAAVCAHVSSEQQAQAGTIDSQVAAILQRAARDGVAIDAELHFSDEGHSGATLLRPALERLRDLAAAGGIDRLYVLCPDRLARAYAYQMLLVDELQECGVELAFINHDLGKTPEDNLLLQVQGMVAEYERAKIMERCRRGKLHAARRGSIAVLSGASLRLPLRHRHPWRRRRTIQRALGGGGGGATDLPMGGPGAGEHGGGVPKAENKGDFLAARQGPLEPQQRLDHPQQPRLQGGGRFRQDADGACSSTTAGRAQPPRASAQRAQFL